MDAVTLSQVLELLKRTGKNTDAAGTTTLFARLAQIAAYVDTLEALIGTTGDAAGSTSAFARLKQIAGYVDELEARIGLDTDTGATVFGKINQALAYTDSLETHLGTMGDAANSNGTVHAKLRDIRNFLGSGSSIASVVKSVQRGVNTFSNYGTYTITINPVNLNKAVLIITTLIQDDLNCQANIWLSSSTQITVEMGSPEYLRKLSWQVIEYY
jgi:hypothetical protein